MHKQHSDGETIGASAVRIRIYPQTPLASTAVADGLLKPDDNLLFPRFFISPLLRDWLPDRIARQESGQA